MSVSFPAASYTYGNQYNKNIHSRGYSGYTYNNQNTMGYYQTQPGYQTGYNPYNYANRLPVAAPPQIDMNQLANTLSPIIADRITRQVSRQVMSDLRNDPVALEQLSMEMSRRPTVLMYIVDELIRDGRLRRDIYEDIKYRSNNV